MTNNRTIFNAEPYADLRVRNCMDWNLNTSLEKIEKANNGKPVSVKL
jgi:hypothetical protein